jgi:branched-subunit amino acid aminotransferase/4-amino-4-deoxychorismate lyase
MVSPSRFRKHAGTSFSSDSGIKTTKSLHWIREYRSKEKSASDDLIFLDTSGHLSEATASNVFFVADGAVYTPPLSCGALPGITRKVVLEILDRVGIPAVSARPLYLAEIQEAAEVFLTSSIREIVPVTLLEGLPVGTGKPGLITRGIMSNYARATRCRS